MKMKMNIYQQEFKMSLRSVITWSLTQVVLIFIFTAIFGSMAESAAMLTEAMDNFPPELLAAFGMTNIDMGSVLGFFALAFLFCQICLAIQAANYGIALLSVEERELTADFLLAKPVKRTQILTSKLLAAFTGLTITNAVVWVSSFVFLNIYDNGQEIDTTALVILLLSIVLFQLFFLTVGMLISLLVKRVRSVSTFSMALVFGLYILTAFSGMLGGTSLEIISPFKQFEPNYIIKNAAYDLPLVLLSLAVTVISIVGSYILYQRRNIPAPV
jgi:ABC-2 type transport system permease protein